MDPPDPALAVIKETLLSRRPAPGSLWVAVASVGVLGLSSLVFWLGGSLGELLPASRAAVFGRSEYWRLLSTLAVHADVEHLLSNAVLLGVLSYLLHGYFGSRVYPVATWALGVLVTAFSLASYPPQIRLIGASGLVYLMAGLWLTLYVFIDRRRTPWKRLLRAAGFALILLVPTIFERTVSYRTHALGFAVGVVFGVSYFRKNEEEIRRAERIEWE